MSFTRSLFLTLAIATASAIATSLDIVERAPINQCCSSLISATSPAVAPILLLLGIVVPPIGQIGVCCKSISSTCADDCDGTAVSCAAVTLSVLGIDIGAGCTPLPPCPPCNTIGTTTSDLFGANMGNAFNDLSAVAGNGTITTTTAPSIQTIFVRHGSVIDGIAVAYASGLGKPQITISHGTSQTADGPTNTAVILNVNETITSVAGVSGTRAPFGLRILQLKFEILDSATNATRIVGPFGSASGTAFNVTGTGPLLALGGFAIDTNSSLAELNGAPGGLYGLTFITSTGLDCPPSA
ncbi:hypothetical protein R3P38DRAFT_3045684 [Favolaschia claudopus]|uniref:Jacalin-type lectin domain-containing protein n=1 Tax=Favolaschia claudopus TaxID=2862362 RepID=A0AAW0A834_9AGAR